VGGGVGLLGGDLELVRVASSSGTHGNDGCICAEVLREVYWGWSSARSAMIVKWAKVGYSQQFFLRASP